MANIQNGNLERNTNRQICRRKSSMVNGGLTIPPTYSKWECCQSCLASCPWSWIGKQRRTARQLFQDWCVLLIREEGKTSSCSSSQELHLGSQNSACSKLAFSEVLEVNENDLRNKYANHRKVITLSKRLWSL